MISSNNAPIYSLELLSPAQNLQFGITAINFGADAVYIGAPLLNARISASNSIVDIEKLCQYAHRYHARVYVAMNTIIYDDELHLAEKTIHQLHQAGADALIIQDLGILEMQLPPLPLHASTQMNNVSLEHIQFLEKVGFSRVILAREMELSQIHNIREKTNIELEAFVYGAVCVSYSGQCYMSHYIGKRSGNRGECAQPCRLKYDLYDEKGNAIIKKNHILSLKDMDRYDYIEQMAKAGISSFKIEGRLKDLNYVKNITAYFRQKIDKLISSNNKFYHASLGKCTFEFTPNPQKTFNRGFSDYFLNGRTPQMKALSQKSIGEYIGKTKLCKGNTIIIDTSKQLNNGDGLCFIDKNNDTIGFRVNKIENNKIFVLEPVEIPIGTEIFRNYDIDFDQKLSKINNCRHIEIGMILKESDKGYILVAYTQEHNISVNYELSFDKQIAQNTEIVRKNIIENLKKTGQTIFVVTKIDIQTENIYFLPISIINQLRRDTLTKLQNEILSLYKRPEKYLIKNEIPYYKSQLDYQNNVSNQLAINFYRRHQVKIIEPAFELIEDKDEKLLMTTKYCVKYELQICPKYHTNKNFSKIFHLTTHNKKFKILFDCQICQMKIFSK